MVLTQYCKRFMLFQETYPSAQASMHVFLAWKDNNVIAKCNIWNEGHMRIPKVYVFFFPAYHTPAV